VDGGFVRAGERWDGGECDRDVRSGGSSDVIPLEWAPTGREVTLTTPRTEVTAGTPITLSGNAISDVRDCKDGVEIKLMRSVQGTTTFETLGTAVTDPDGNYSKDLSSKVSASYRAVLPETDCADAASEEARVGVRKKLALSSSRAAVRPGGAVRLRVKVHSCTEGVSDRVVLSKRVDGAFKRLSAKRTNATCVAVFKRRINKRSVFKAYSPMDADQLAGYSPRAVVRLK
jgi:hypothetical protein